MITTARHTVSFILPAFNEEQHIGRCLESIQAEMRPSDEIIVVDNGSADRTPEIVAGFENVQLLIHPEINISALRNRGAAASNGSLLAFIDSDCLVCPGWRESLERRMADEKVMATGSISDLPDDATWVEQAWWSFRTPEPRCVNYIASANLIIRRNVFEELNGFDEALITDEDSDIGARINTRGYCIMDDPAIRVIHLANAKTLRQFMDKEKWHATSILRTTSASRIDKAMIMTMAFMLSALLFLVSLPLTVVWPFAPLIGLGLILLTLAATAAFRALQYRTLRYFFHWLILYFVFYLARSLTILRFIFAGPDKSETRAES